MDNPGSDVREICKGVKGHPRKQDITYLNNVLDILSNKGIIIQTENKRYTAVADVDFDKAYYAESKYVCPEDILDYLLQMGGSTTVGIDRALGYESIRGSYPALLQLEKKGRITRVKKDIDGKYLWYWTVTE